MDCLMLQGGYPPWLLYENPNIKLRTNDSSKLYSRLQYYTLYLLRNSRV